MSVPKAIPIAWQRTHDHGQCIADAIDAAARICESRGIRLTPLRRRVLELVWENHKPVGAYGLLDELKREHSSAAPPTIYRALDFLMEQGFVHRIQSLNAYVGCNDPGHSHKGIFLICNDCGDALEIEDKGVANTIDRFASRMGFLLTSQSVEAAGLCPGCQEA